MAFDDNYTKIIDGNVHFNIDAFPGETTNLLEYVNQECKKCNVTASIDNPPECECPTSRLYYAMVKLALMEQKEEKATTEGQGEALEIADLLEDIRDISYLAGKYIDCVEYGDRENVGEARRALKRKIREVKK